jgi:hypothetical protein
MEALTREPVRMRRGRQKVDSSRRAADEVFDVLAVAFTRLAARSACLRRRQSTASLRTARPAAPPLPEITDCNPLILRVVTASCQPAAKTLQRSIVRPETALAIVDWLLVPTKAISMTPCPPSRSSC